MSRSKRWTCARALKVCTDWCETSWGRSTERACVSVHQQNQDAIEGTGVGRQRLMGLRQAPGEGPVSLAGSGRQAQRFDAAGRVGDASERSGPEAHAAAQLVSQKRVKKLRVFAESRLR